MTETPVELIHVQSGPQLAHVRALFEEYAATLGVDLCFQNFETELAELPWEYVPPEGRLLLATTPADAAGCIALRKIAGDTCEMKRLYVRPAFRGQRIGRMLVTALIEEARRIGYARMRLDTLPSMTEAAALYRSFGFREIAPYRYNPVENSVFMELGLG